MKQSLILDEETYIAVHATLDRARRNGWDAVEVLNSAGLLLSPAARQQIQLTALAAFRADVNRWLPHEFLRRVRKVGTSSPTDMHGAMMGYLADYIKALKEQE